MNTVLPASVVLEPTPLVISILEEYLAELEAGAQPYLEELVARCPEMAEPLKACPASLKLINEGIGGGIYNLGTFSLDTLSLVFGNHASTSNNNKFGF